MLGSTRSYALARRLVEKGHEVHMIAAWRESRDQFSGWRNTDEEGIKVHWLALEYSNHFSYPRRMLQFVRFALGAALRSAEIGGDVVFATSTPLTIALPGVYCAKRLGVPFVFEVRDLWPEIPIRLGALKNPLLIWGARQLEAMAYRAAAHIVALSPDMAAGVKAVNPDRPVTVIPNFADSSIFASEARKIELLPHSRETARRPTVLYAGTLGLVNHVGYLVEIARAARARGDSLRFVIAGDGREEKQVRELAVAYGLLGESVIMLSPVPKNQVRYLFQEADVTISLVRNEPALWANSANKIFDSLAAGKPIVINHEGWLADIIRRHEVGLVLPPEDPLIAARMLSELLQDRARVARYSANALRLANSEFSLDGLVDKLESVLLSSITHS